MIEKITLSVFLFFNSIGNSIEPSVFNDKSALNKIRKEIKVLERKIELTNIIESDSTVRNIRNEKFTNDIIKLKKKETTIKEINKLKEKWAKEDSTSSIKPQPLVEL
jgi:hypothetical protein